MQYVRAGTVGLLLLVLVGIVALVPRADAQQANVSPAAGPPGTRFAFAAAGFQADERVDYWIDMPDGRVRGSLEYKVEADAAGGASWEWRAPPGAVPGIWRMVARGRESAVERVIPFEITLTGGVTAPGEPVGQPGQIGEDFNVAPRVGRPGTRFDFFARGFDDDESVSYWLNAPDGSLVSSSDFTARANDGRADWSWEAPTAPLIGTWSMVIRGDRSGIQWVIVFEIR